VDWNLLSDITSRTLASALRASAARQTVLADNIANGDTPGFIRRDLPFEQALAAAVQGARRAPDRASDLFSAVDLSARFDRSRPARADGNNVDIDREMVALAENSLRYQAASEALAGRIRLLRAAIQSGRG